MSVPSVPTSSAPDIQLERHPCPCCGHRTLLAPSPSWATCPVCCWTDEDTADPAVLDQLFRAQRALMTIGASEERWLATIRPPTADEARPDDWQPMAEPSPREQERTALSRTIREAFAGVAQDGREGLRATYRHDYDGEPDIEWDDDEPSWDRIPGHVLDFFGSGTTAFTFGNLAGFRYYLPAFMLRSLTADNLLVATWALDLALKPGADPAALVRVRALDHDQRLAVVAFLRYVLHYHRPAPWAERALARVWAPATAAATTA